MEIALSGLAAFCKALTNSPEESSERRRRVEYAESSSAAEVGFVGPTLQKASPAQTPRIHCAAPDTVLSSKLRHGEVNG